MTLKEFETLYNLRRKEKMPLGYFPKRFKLEKSKITKKAVIVYKANEHGIPYIESKIPAVSKKVFDMNAFNNLCQAVWEYYLGTKLKRISSEGKWRPNGKGGGFFIKSENKGFADLHGICNGIGVYIETKQKYEKHLPSQIEFAKWVRDGGGIYVSARSFDDIYDIVQCLIALDYSGLQKYF